MHEKNPKETNVKKQYCWAITHATGRKIRLVTDLSGRNYYVGRRMSVIILCTVGREVDYFIRCVLSILLGVLHYGFL